MIKAKLQRLERKVKVLGLEKESFPSAIVIRVVGCFNPKPERLTISDTGAVPIIRLCKPGDGECEACQYFDLERLRANPA